MSSPRPMFLPDIPNFYTVFNIPECTSTNSVLRERAGALPEGFVLVADSQTAGRGRQGRSFFSPGSTGLYLSVLLRPCLTPKDVTLITPAAAVAAARAADFCFGVRTDIKWVNDLYLNGKKLCGILAESSFERQDTLRHVVLGVGINIAAPPGGFPGEISDIAGALTERPAPGDRERLAAAFLREFYRLYSALPETGFFPEYRERNIIKNRDVTVVTPSGSYPARALDVGPDFSLALRLPDGSNMSLAAGEVSIRGWL